MRIVESLSNVGDNVINIYLKKSRGPKMDTCGTPALINFQSDTAFGRITRKNSLARV